jgi:hypothetical protein
MKITEAKAKELGMSKNAAGDWVSAGYTEFVESSKLGGSNTGMARARGFLRGDGRSKNSPALVRESIISSAVKMGMSTAEAEMFAELGRRGQ